MTVVFQPSECGLLAPGFQQDQTPFGNCLQAIVAEEVCVALKAADNLDRDCSGF